MAKRSDFAQKLLDDLRLRKQRMASSHNSNQSHHLPIDAYAYTKQTYRGSRNTTANKIVSCRTGEMLNSSRRNQRSVNSGQVSNQMVPYGKGQSSGQTGDISLALSIAFENAGKLRRADSIMSFLHQIKRGTLEFSASERQLASTSHYPVQINEISKGAQKLNQILRACSNGLNMGTCSIQFAKELLQGAIDLEESLRMLVDLQKNSEFMITRQKKNRIMLLEEDNDKDDDTRMEMQLARPTFTSDKHTQDIQQVGRAIFMQRPITLTNSNEGRNSNNENKNVKMQVSHKRSTTTSSISDIKNSEGKKQTASSPEKGRIPNVIAKLMGLDNLPYKVDVESKNMMPQKTEGKHTAKGSTKKAELKNKQADSLTPIRNQKVIETFKMSATMGEEVIFGANKNLLTQKPGSEMAIQNGKPLWRDLDRIKAPKDYDKSSIKIDMHTNSSAQKKLTRDVQEMGRKQDHPNNNNREHKGNVKGRTNDPIVNNMLEQVHERPEVKSSIQEEKEIDGKIVHLGKGHTNKHIMSKEKKHQNNVGVQKLYVLPKNGPHEERQRREQEIQLKKEQMLMMRPHGGSEMTSSKPPHQRKQLSTNHAHDLVRDEASKDTNEKVKETTNRILARDQEFERAKRSGIKTLMDKKHVYKLASKKIKNTSKQKVDMPGKIDQVWTGRNGAKLVTKQVKPTSNKFSEAEQERVSMFIEADTGSNEPVAVTKPLDMRRQPHKEASTLSSSGGGELQSQQDLVATVTNDLHYQDVQPVTINLQYQAVPVAADEGFKTDEVAFHRINGIQEDRMCVNHSQLEEQNISEISTQQPLTESENCLKWILVMSQLFVNTAEALFRLNIPFNVLQGAGQENRDEGSKLILDCGYEVMKRKGIRQELKVHSCSKISMGTTNIISLDDLVTQLNKDMENLKFYGRERSCQVDVEDYLPKMLEHDVYDKDPDIGCMWDLGWKDETFAFIEKYDVIRDTEKHILGFLLDEITGDFCMFKED